MTLIFDKLVPPWIYISRDAFIHFLVNSNAKNSLKKAKNVVFFLFCILVDRPMGRVVGNSEKRTPWWNQEVKEAIRAKKDAFKAWLQDRSSSDLQSRYTEARKAATSAVKKSKEKSWEEFGRR